MDQLSKFIWITPINSNVLREFRVKPEVGGGRKKVLEYSVDGWEGER